VIKSYSKQRLCQQIAAMTYANSSLVRLLGDG
jgi:hypothetical protein